MKRKSKSIFGGMIRATIDVASNLKQVGDEMQAAYKRAAEFQAIDTYREANRAMGFKVSRSKGTATGGGESKRKPKKPGQTVTGRVRHDEFGLQKFAYAWKDNKELRVGPLAHGTAGDVDEIHQGGRGKTRYIYKDKFLFDKKKRGKGMKKAPNRTKAKRYLGDDSRYSYRLGDLVKLGYVITNRKVLHDKPRFKYITSTSEIKSRPYLKIATDKMEPKFQQKIDKQLALSMKKVKLNGYR